EAVENVVAGEGAVQLLLAVRVENDRGGLQVERVRAHPTQAVIGVIHELRSCGDGIQRLRVHPAGGLNGAGLKTRRYQNRGEDEHTSTGDHEGHSHITQRRNWNATRCAFDPAARELTCPRAASQCFVPPVTTSVNEVVLKSTGPAAVSVPVESW